MTTGEITKNGLTTTPNRSETQNLRTVPDRLGLDAVARWASIEKNAGRASSEPNETATRLRERRERGLVARRAAHGAARGGDAPLERVRRCRKNKTVRPTHPITGVEGEATTERVKGKRWTMGRRKVKCKKTGNGLNKLWSLVLQDGVILTSEYTSYPGSSHT